MASSSLPLAAIFLFCYAFAASSAATPRFLSLVQPQPLVLNYHKGPLLNGNITVNVLWYGTFSPGQRSILSDFFLSLGASSAPSPSVSSWWRTIGSYRGGPRDIVLGRQVFDSKYGLGKSLTSRQVRRLARRLGTGGNAVNFMLTAADVSVEDFCMSSCGSHEYARAGRKGARFVYAWVGNPVSQCPGQCAWPFHKPVYGPQGPPLVAPNGDVGVDGMVINIATVLAGAVTNPFDSGYYQGSAEAPLEAVSACTGIFGKGAFPGYPGVVLMDKTTGASYNANGVSGRRFLLPAMWDPTTFACKTLV
ncbi:hypothetical protein MLD38_001987 [Melastoma candidum]|uniref:Uncharacterized protein n=1 Tax=Melastoma candidum TaxID=119954 RepID=A0ACB9SF40_9MYRT|nr:hypothetical protein MLD38_001987 [Melastoma candidum]